MEWYVVFLETDHIQNPPCRDKNQTVFLKVLVIILAYQQLTSSLCPWEENIFLLLRDGTVHNGLGPPILVKKINNKKITNGVTDTPQSSLMEIVNHSLFPNV